MKIKDIPTADDLEDTPSAPELALLAAIISRAIADAAGIAITELHHTREAKAWLRGRTCKMYCDYLNLDHRSLLKALEINLIHVAKRVERHRVHEKAES